MANIKRFHPGVYIRENLKALEMTARELSARTGISERTLSSIITGKGSVTFDVAKKLSIYFDNSIEFWINLQTLYDKYMDEMNDEDRITKEWTLLKTIKNYLIEIKCLSKDDSKEKMIEKCRLLCGVNDLTLLNKKDTFSCFKEQHIINNEVNYFCQNFWIALALNEARKKKNVPYNRRLLINSIQKIRCMTKLDPQIFYPRLKEIFNQCGISFILMPYLTKSNIYGATKWFSRDNVMVAISNRGKKADLFWFTLFHEISHVLMEHRRETLFDMEGVIDNEADEMASSFLIPNDMWQHFIDKNSYTIDTINDFANKVNVHPCIILGRLHKEQKVPYGTFDKIFNVSYEINLTF